MNTAELSKYVSLLKSEYVKLREVIEKRPYRIGRRWDSSFEKAAKLCLTLSIEPVEYIAEAHKFMSPFAQKIGMPCFAPNMMNSDKFLSWLMRKYLKTKGTGREAVIEEQVKSQVMTDMCNSEHMFSSCLASFLRNMLNETKKVPSKEELLEVRKAVIIYLAESLSKYWLITDWQVADMYVSGIFSPQVVKRIKEAYEVVGVRSWRVLLWDAKQDSYRNCSDALSNVNLVDWAKKIITAVVQDEKLPEMMKPEAVKLDIDRLEGEMMAAGDKLSDDSVPLKDRISELKKIADEVSDDK